jgi:hypothetical protein
MLRCPFVPPLLKVCSAGSTLLGLFPPAGVSNQNLSYVDSM